MKKTLSTTLLISSLALGANAPSSSDILRDVKPQTMQKSLKTIPSLNVKKFVSPIADDKGVKIKVSSFIIEGNTIFTSEVLNTILSSYINKELTISQLKEAASIITKYYRDKGYFVARAYVPAQELKKENAKVKILVIEGLYGNVSINNSSLISNELAQKYMKRLNNSVISMKSLERQLLLLEDLNGVRVTNSQIQAGQEISHADFNLTLEDEAKYNTYLLADNYGSRYTGTYRINAIASVHSLNSLGDNLSINALSSNTQGIKSANVSYDIPLAYDGLILSTSVSKTKYEVGKEFKSQEIAGNSTSFTLGLSYPLVKQRAHTVNTSAVYTYQKINDSSISEDKQKVLNSIKISLEDTLQTSYFNKKGLLNTSISLSKGKLSLKTADSITSDATLDSEGNYSKINFAMSYTQVLKPLLSLQTSFQAQKALGHKNLDGTEDISIGGAYGARSYNSSEASGDNGYLASIELFYALPKYKKLSHTISTFYDHGKVWFDEDKSTSLNTRTLNSLGLAYISSYENMQFKTSFAHGFGKDKTPTANGDDTNLNQFFFQLIARF